jgi:DNA replication protein DnaC
MVGYKCPLCKDMGWLRAADANGQVIWEGNRPRLVRCGCQRPGDEARRTRYLERIDGLSPAERGLTFEGLVAGANGDALAAVRAATHQRRGMITLTGKPGTGKSSVLMAAVNEARAANVPAVYTTVTDLLDYLRAAYNPQQAELAFDARWDLLVRAEVLALDELDEFNTTPWAMERFLRLMDERWRAMDRCVTLCATNARLNALPEKVASRLRDGRAMWFEMRGADMRPYASW